MSPAGEWEPIFALPTRNILDTTQRLNGLNGFGLFPTQQSMDMDREDKDSVKYGAWQKTWEK